MVAYLFIDTNRIKHSHYCSGQKWGDFVLSFQSWQKSKYYTWQYVLPNKLAFCRAALSLYNSAGIPASLFWKLQQKPKAKCNASDKNLTSTAWQYCTVFTMSWQCLPAQQQSWNKNLQFFHQNSQLICSQKCHYTRVQGLLLTCPLSWVWWLDMNTSSF